jgi:hypothetical protein
MTPQSESAMGRPALQMSLQFPIGHSADARAIAAATAAF